MNPSKAVQQSIVVIKGTLSGGRVITQELPVPHEGPVTDSQLVGHAITVIRAAGGLMVDGEGGSVNFFPLLMFTGGINLSVQRVSLAFGTLASQ